MSDVPSLLSYIKLNKTNMIGKNKYIEEYRLSYKIGEGEYGTVYKAFDD